MAGKSYNIGPCDCCGEVGAPCSCPENFGEDKDHPDYKINDMSATYFGAISGTGIYGEELDYYDEISDCDYCYGYGIIEKGYVYYIPSDANEYNNGPCFWSSLGGDDECTWLKNPANGKFYTLSVDYFNNPILIRLDTTLCRWVLYVSSDQPGGTFDIWYGTKTTGLTPAGTYNRIGGNSSRATVDIEEV